MSSQKGFFVFLSGMLLISGCATYHSPGGAADMRLFDPEAPVHTDNDIAAIMKRKPLSPLPVHLAIARVQAPDYRGAYGRGVYSILTVREFESDDDYNRLAGLSDIAAAGPIGRLVLPYRLENERDLRHAAARMNADMLLVYTIESDFFIDDDDEPVSIITLGISPHVRARIVVTASAALLDVRNGYLYGVLEATDRAEHQVNHWTSKDAVEKSRRELAKKTYEQLLRNFEQLWPRVAERRRADLRQAPI